MNTLIRCSIPCAALLLMAGCATHGTMQSQPAAAAATQDMYEQDNLYIQAVETVARRRGVEVRWVNPPLKRMVASVDDNGQD